MSSVLPSMKMMARLLAVIAVIVAAIVGNHFGATRERLMLAEELAERENNLPPLEEQVQQEMAELRTQRDLADSTNLALQDKLKEVQAELLDQKSKMRLYENIEGSDISTGLGVDTVTKVLDENGQLTELLITVVQARGRDRVQGRIGVMLIGKRDDINWREIIVEVEAEDAPRFDMRFFQTLVVPIPDNDVLIESVEINVESDGKKHKPVSYKASWSSIFAD